MTRPANTTTEALNYLAEARIVPTVAVLAVEFAACVSKWATRRDTRKALARLTEWELRDVGLTPEEARFEASKVFWRV